jgi:hypothetical protein
LYFTQSESLLIFSQASGSAQPRKKITLIISIEKNNLCIKPKRA